MFRSISYVAVLVFLLGLLSGCTRKEKETQRQYLLEKVRDVAVVQLYGDEFKNLSLENKLLAYDLYRAALAGRDIAYDQTHRYALEIRNLLEEIITHSEGIDPAVLEKILEYTKLIWIHNAHYNTRTFRKFLPSFTFEELQQAAELAEGNGARFDLRRGEDLAAKLGRLRRSIFDPQYEPAVTNKNPGAGADILQASANNLYEGVTLAEAEAYPEKYPLNSKMVKVHGVITELVYRAGTDRIPPGLYARELSNVIYWLEKAKAHAGGKQAVALDKLIRYFRTGDPEDFRQFNIAWVQNDPVVETINGFIEVYKDARGQKGMYEGLVSFRNEVTTAMMHALAENAGYYEARAPWQERYKRQLFNIPVATAINVLCETGDAGPISWSGINLPNAQEIRQKYGSKSFLLINGMEARDSATGKIAGQEFILDPRERELDRKYGAQARLAIVAMHEVLGHASGKVSDKLKGDPANYLREYYSTIEEARADLVALWNLTDPKTLEIGVITDREAAEAGMRAYVRGDLIQLRRVPQGDSFEEDHMRGTHMIVNYLRDRFHAVETVERDGKAYFQVTNLDSMHAGVGALLAELMRIKAEGDYQAAKELVSRYGVKFDTALRDQVVQRCKAIGYPNYVAFVYPELSLVRNAAGEVTDVSISYPMDLKEQMLKFKRLSSQREEVAAAE